MKRIEFSGDDSNHVKVSNSLYSEAVDLAVEEGRSPQETLAEILGDPERWESVE